MKLMIPGALLHAQRGNSCAKGWVKNCVTDVGFWKDNAQVASEICEKFWAEVPGIYVRVEEIGTEVPQ